MLPLSTNFISSLKLDSPLNELIFIQQDITLINKYTKTSQRMLICCRRIICID